MEVIHSGQSLQFSLLQLSALLATKLHNFYFNCTLCTLRHTLAIAIISGDVMTARASGKRLLYRLLVVIIEGSPRPCRQGRGRTLG